MTRNRYFWEPTASHADVWVRLIHIRHYGICLPTFLLLFFKLRFQDDTDSKQVIYVFELAFLFFHFLIDGMNGLVRPFMWKCSPASSNFCCIGAMKLAI